MSDAILFCLVTGVFSTLVLDLWGQLAGRLTGIPPTNWGVVGRWLRGIPKGHWVLRGDDQSAPRACEKALGWAFHYLVGIAYSVLLLLFWGIEFAQAPQLLPILFIGVVVSTLAGLMILMPGLGGGLFGRKMPNQAAILVYVVVAHIVYALALYAAAVAISG